MLSLYFLLFIPDHVKSVPASPRTLHVAANKPAVNADGGDTYHNHSDSDPSDEFDHVPLLAE